MSGLPPPAYDDKKEESSSLEKGQPEDFVVTADDRYRFDVHDLDQVQRRLKQRHVQMIAVSALSIPLLPTFLPTSLRRSPALSVQVSSWVQETHYGVQALSVPLSLTPSSVQSPTRRCVPLVK